jgi:anti-anti-sigma factor
LVTLRGEFDVASREALRQELRSALESCSGDTVLIDLSGVEFLDCTAVGILVRAHNEATGMGRRLVLLGASGGVQKLLDITHIDRTIATRPHLQAALSRPAMVPRLGIADVRPA